MPKCTAVHTLKGSGLVNAERHLLDRRRAPEALFTRALFSVRIGLYTSARGSTVAAAGTLRRRREGEESSFF